jgi:hypothetical protein
VAKGRKLPVDIPRLGRAVQTSRRQLQAFREERLDMVRQYAGQSYNTRTLVAKNPRFLLSTIHRKHAPAVAATQEWLNRQVERMHLARKLQRGVLDGMFSLSVTKVALADPAMAARAGWNIAAGQPFADNVDLDDWVMDMYARSWESCAFMGHRYRVPLEAVREDKSYSAARKDLQHSEDFEYNDGGDERVSHLGRSQYGLNEELEDMVDLWEIYVPRRRLVLTLAAGGDGLPVTDADPLKVQPWMGPDDGPYHPLMFDVVPGNLMPKSPVMDLYPLHNAVNSSFRKLTRQAERLKVIGLTRGGASEDGSRIQATSDGEMIRVDDPASTSEFTMGGPNAQLFAYFMQAKDLFDFLAGNLSIMGGLSPQSKTATQDKLLNENSSRSVADMQEVTTSYARRVGGALAWYYWHHPFDVQESQYQVPGLPEASLLRKVHPLGARDMVTNEPAPLQRDARWDQLDLKVDPYSLQPATPQSRAAALKQLVMEVVLPAMPLLQQQGIGFDMNKFLTKIAELTDMPDLPDILSVQEPPTGNATTGGTEAQPGMAASTTRNYVRESMPGRTDKGNTQNMVSSLLGVNPGGDPQANGKTMMSGMGGGR